MMRTSAAPTIKLTNFDMVSIAPMLCIACFMRVSDLSAHVKICSFTPASLILSFTLSSLPCLSTLTTTLVALLSSKP